MFAEEARRALALATALMWVLVGIFGLVIPLDPGAINAAIGTGTVALMVTVALVVTHLMIRSNPNR